MYIEPQPPFGPLAKRLLELLYSWFPQPAYNIFPEVALGRFLKLVQCTTPIDTAFYIKPRISRSKTFVS